MLTMPVNISTQIIGPKQTEIIALHNDYCRGTWDATIGWTSLVVSRQEGHPSLRDDLKR